MSKQSEDKDQINPDTITVTIKKDASIEDIVRGLEPVWENLHQREHAEFILFMKSGGEAATRASVTPFSFVASLAAQIQAVAIIEE